MTRAEPHDLHPHADPPGKARGVVHRHVISDDPSANSWPTRHLTAGSRGLLEICWWRCGESNPGPDASFSEALRA
jgi:hypothetical protein